MRIYHLVGLLFAPVDYEEFEELLLFLIVNFSETYRVMIIIIYISKLGVALSNQSESKDFQLKIREFWSLVSEASHFGWWKGIIYFANLF